MCYSCVWCRYDAGIGSISRLKSDVIVKLGDYGTSIILHKRTPQPVSLESYTTFENTPPEYLYGGDAVVKVCLQLADVVGSERSSIRCLSL